MKSVFSKFALFSLLCLSLKAQEETKIDEEIPIVGKIDLGLAYVHVDLLKSGVTRHRMDLCAFKADLSYRFWKCLLIKPAFLYGHGRHKDRVCNGGLGLGLYLPIAQGFTITPSVGVTFGNLKTTYKVKIPVPNVPALVTVPVEEKFYSSSPYLAVEVSYTFIPSWRLITNVQYSWSHTRTTIKPLLKDKSHSQGWSYSAMIEADLNPHWSINLGGAYNVSLTKEKHGLRAYGFKLGVAYWF